MIVTKLDLTNFRNYAKHTFEFSGVNVIIGDNGVGKSNILEAIYLLATGKSFRADRESEMITYDNQFSILNYKFEIDEETFDVKITLTDGSTGNWRKKFETNGVGRRQIDVVGKLRAVLFAPQDMELLTGSPSNRRRYLDFVISQVNREYRRCILAYEKGLRQRNKLLEQIREGRGNRTQLFFWDKTLIKNGNYISDMRRTYLSKLNAYYDASEISEARLLQYETEEEATATTLVGPHRDDFWVEREGKDVSKYGSRGEMRMEMLRMKLIERDYLVGMQEGYNESRPYPVLLLDDVFSELDHRHREEIVGMIDEQVNNGGQVIMTTADEHIMPIFKNVKVIKL